MDSAEFTAAEMAAIRSEFPFIDDRIYLNFASVGPLPVRARRVIDRINDTLQRLDTNFDPETFAAVERCRIALAKLVGGAPDGIGLIPNTSFGLNWAFAAFGLGPGDAVLITDHEFPALAYSALNLKETGVGVVSVPVPAGGGLDPVQLEDELARHPEVRVVAVSWCRRSPSPRRAGSQGAIPRRSRDQGRCCAKSCGHRPNLEFALKC